MIIAQSLFINYIIILIFIELGCIFSRKLNLKTLYEKIFFGFSLFILLNFLFYFKFYLTTKTIIYFWVILICIIFLINIYRYKKIYFFEYLLTISKFILPITIIYCLIPIFYNEQFYIFRGNHWDLFSYLSIASLFNDVTFNDILNGNLPLFYFHFEDIEKLAFSRPITSYFLSILLNFKSVNIFLIVFFFKLIFVILSSISIYSFLIKFKNNKLSSYILAIIFSFSFWLIYIFEIDALSHLLSISLFVFVISEMYNFDKSLKKKNNSFIIYFAIINSALFIIYPEIFIVSSLIILSCLISDVLKDKKLIKIYVYFSIKFIFFFLITSLFAFKTNYQFLYEQTFVVLSQNKDWWGYFGSFILGKENLVLDELFVYKLKIFLSKNNLFQTLTFIINSHIENDYNFYFLNFVPSILGFYYITIGKFDSFFIYTEIIVVVLFQFYLIYIFYKNIIILLKSRKLLYSFISIFILSSIVLIKGNIWSIIKIYFYISPFIFILVASKFNIYNKKISSKLNFLVCMLLLVFPIYKYTSYNSGIGKLDSFPSIMHPEMKKNFNWNLDLNKIAKCNYVLVEEQDYIKKSYLILNFLHSSVSSNIINSINSTQFKNCYLIVENNQFIIK